MSRGLKKGIEKLFRKGFDMFIGSGLSQEMNSIDPAKAGPEYYYSSEELVRLVRAAAAEGCVLLENDGALPLAKDEPAAVFGRCQYDWFFVGYGSGGDVHAPYKIGLIDGMKNAGAAFYAPLAEEYLRLVSSDKYRADHGWWGHWPFSHPELEIGSSLIDKAAEECRTAIVVIGRAAGEDRDNKPLPGSWYLTAAERKLLDRVTERFRRVVVILNIGSLIDLSWIKEYGDKLSAVLIAWLGGQESGNAVCDVLYGAVSPSGRLPATAARLEGYPGGAFGISKRAEYSEGIFMGYRYFDRFAPEKVLYPFLHGLSYTGFEFVPRSVSLGEAGLTVRISVKNTGARPGSTAVPVFVRPPEGRLDKPLRTLVSFGKTGVLAPGAEEEIALSCDKKSLASFDGERHSFILEAGEYRVYADKAYLGSAIVPEEELIEVCEPIVIPSAVLRERILSRLPEPIPGVKRKLRFGDVLSGAASAEEFVSSLSDEELADMTRGHGMMNSELGPAGNAGVFGGVTEALKAKGVPPVSCCDGPAGLRMQRFSALIPCGTALAASMNTRLIEALHVLLGREMEHFGVDVRLAPGMNLMRHPLCGRNFEYFSEDPVLSGLTAAACVNGVQSVGKAACPKHFACNNQEYKRNVSDSAVSERALRELYLRNFEICVKASRPMTLMTSYNKVNGVWSHYNYDLVETVLRREWGFDGLVMTDWWMQSARSPQFRALRDNAYRVRAGVDVLMPGNKSHVSRRFIKEKSIPRALKKRDGLTRAELEQSALRVVRLAARLNGGGSGTVQ